MTNKERNILLKIIVAIVVPIVALLIILSILKGMEANKLRGFGYDYSAETALWIAYFIGVGIFEYNWLKRN